MTVKKDKQFSFRKSTGHKKFGTVKDTNQARKILYDSTWEKYRIIFLKVNPTCYACGDKSQIVDHITAHKADEALFKSTTNHLPLCTKCHNTVTAYFDKFNPPKTQEKVEWIHRYRMTRNVGIQVKVLPKYGDS